MSELYRLQRGVGLGLRTRAPSRHADNRIVMGRYSYGTPLVRVYEGDAAVVHVGDFVSIADDVVFLVGGNHHVDWVSTFPLRAVLGLPGAFEDGHPATKGDIMVGSDVWIGRGATILSGVTIGDGAVVAAEAVVARDVRPYAIVVGNPAREVRRRFDDGTIEELLRIAWWRWPIERIIDSADLLNGASVADFLRAATKATSWS
jgi:acetyltransferase-like isoleucine patch superfamily enzyme